MSQAPIQKTRSHLVKEKLASWWDRLFKPIFPRQGSEESYADPVPVAVEQLVNAPENDLPVHQKPRPSRSRLLMKLFSKRGSRGRGAANEAPAPLAHEQPDKTTETNVAMPTRDQGQASENPENHISSEVTSDSAPKSSRTFQEEYSRAPNSVKDVQTEPDSPSPPDQVHRADEEETILAKSIQNFAKQKPKMFALLKDQIDDFQRLNVESWDTWLNVSPVGQSESPQDAWISRYKMRLPAFSALRNLAVRVSMLDPHGLAPYIVTGGFAAIELCLGIIDPTDRHKALDMMLNTSIIINSWNSYEVDLAQIKMSPDDEIVDSIPEIERLIGQIYDQGLVLIATIYEDGKSKSSRAIATVTCGPVKWKEQLDTLDLVNRRCTQKKSEVDKKLKRKKENAVILNWIKCKDDPEPTHEDMRVKTGLEPTSQELRQKDFRPVTEDVFEWLLQLPQFTSWVEAIVQEKDAAKGVCWLKGIMGTGKSTLMCQVVSHYHKLPLDGVRLVHYYCDGSKAPGTPPPDYEIIIRALCCRLAWDDNGRLAGPAVTFHAKFNPKYAGPDSKPTINEWETLLRDLITTQRRRVVFVIDALDEYRSPQDYRSLLKCLADMRSTPRRPCILLSSRKQLRIKEYFESDLGVVDLTDNITLQPLQDDFQEFIRHAISSKQNDPDWKKSIFFSDRCLRERLEAALFKSAGGMFRWVQVWLGVFFPINENCIEKPSTAEKLLEQLEDFQTLDHLRERDEGKAMKTAYTNLWKVNGDSQYRKDQLRAFRTYLAAGPYLTPDQLLEAVRFHPDVPDEDAQSFELHQLEGLYHNFLKKNQRGFLEFEHVSASTFVLELKMDCNEPIFSAKQNSRFMADFCIKAFERPEHPIWKNAGFDLAHWSQIARRIGCTLPDVRENLRREMALLENDDRCEIAEDLQSILEQLGDPDVHFAKSLLVDHFELYRRTAKDETIDQRFIALSQSNSPGFDGYLLTTIIGIYYSLLCTTLS